jgi:hypothetical protein
VSLDFWRRGKTDKSLTASRVFPDCWQPMKKLPYILIFSAMLLSFFSLGPVVPEIDVD